MKKLLFGFLALALFAATGHAAAMADAADEAFTYVNKELPAQQQNTRPQDDIQALLQKTQKAQQAIEAGLQAMEERENKEALTEEDQEISNILNKTFPALLNSLGGNVTLKSLEPEIKNVCTKAVRLLVSQQTKYSTDIDYEIAASLFSMTAMQYAALTGLLEESTLEELMIQSLKMLPQEQ